MWTMTTIEKVKMSECFVIRYQGTEYTKSTSVCVFNDVSDCSIEVWHAWKTKGLMPTSNIAFYTHRHTDTHAHAHAHTHTQSE